MTSDRTEATETDTTNSVGTVHHAHSLLITHESAMRVSGVSAVSLSTLPNAVKMTMHSKGKKYDYYRYY